MDPSHTKLPELDLLVIGAGAAGLWSALCAARQLERRGLSPTALRIAVFDSREKYGAKILMSGGTRCNLTHVKVTAEDYRGGNRNIVARVLRAQPEVESRRIFEEDLGLATKTEPNGKVFPADDSARSVLAAIVRGLERMQIPILGGRRCVGLDPDANGIRVLSSMAGEANETLETRARRVILATGGLSFPKSGSDGLGLSLLARLGHTVVPPVPALTPVVLRSRFHTELAGIASPVALSYFEDGALRHRCEGPMLWTHFGLSGPAALDVSGPWARARVDRPNVAREVQCNFCPEETAESLDARWL
ncbi:MAG: aminoacetone oxidase family FAD-binding enzyme, partial [Candidatus Eisenbacteria bacterium]